MNAATITALCTGIPAVIAAVTALVAQLQHRNDPGAHGGQGHPGAGQ